MKNYIAAADIGGTKVTASLADKEGFKIRIYQPVKLEGDNTTIPIQVDSMIEYGCKETGIKKKHIKALGVGAPGPFKNMIEVRRWKPNKFYREVTAPNLCRGVRGSVITENEWLDIPLEYELSKIYRKVRVENDWTAAMMAERLFGAAREEDNAFCIGPGKGLGGGAWVSGVDEKGKKRSILLTGDNGNAVEPCYMLSGNTYMEDLISGKAIERLYGDKAEHAFKAYRKGDERAKKVIHEVADNFGNLLASINALQGNKVFAIGGGMFMKNKDILLYLIGKSFRKYQHESLPKDVEIKPSSFGEYLGDLGALSLVMPKDWVEDWQKRKPWEEDIETITLT